MHLLKVLLSVSNYQLEDILARQYQLKNVYKLMDDENKYLHQYQKNFSLQYHEISFEMNQYHRR